ncbi:hypothetical protein SAMN04487897_11221 [Paenibacillus sp. yr247]|uniref:hypothetical protein n=1 Tax=Paenibacillus sp. yr247 TaxID=1761880 RepID=UPI00088E5F05|nr:hypothetical protein SAMN04487897_11221 [Paenibacillus sp. yr247]
MLGIGSDDTLTLVLIYPTAQKPRLNDPLKIVLGNEGFLDNPEDMEAVKKHLQNLCQKYSGRTGIHRSVLSSHIADAENY